MVNVALVLPPGTVTVAGTLATAELLLLRDTTAPPLGAGPLNVTVPVDVLPPRTLVGVRVSELSVGRAAVTVSVTLTVWGVFVAPAAAIVIAFAYVPAARAALATETVRLALPDPLAGLTDSHAGAVASAVAVQVIVPPLLLERAIV